MTLSAILHNHQRDFHPVVRFEPGTDALHPFDFTERNKDLSAEEIADTDSFAAYINDALKKNSARYGIGGYGEHRTLYARSQHFDQVLANDKVSASATVGSEVLRMHPAPDQPRLLDDIDVTKEKEGEPRRLHLGIDIWGPAGTPVMAPLNGVVHSFAFNNNDSDYGATLILTHNLDGVGFHTLYGHLSLNSLKNLYEGKNVNKGEVIAEFGMRFENGNWPPHLHFQVITDMQGWKGDYPGVCRYSERERWLDNCPDPNLILQLI